MQLYHTSPSRSVMHTFKSNFIEASYASPCTRHYALNCLNLGRTANGNISRVAVPHGICEQLCLTSGENQHAKGKKFSDFETRAKF